MPIETSLSIDFIYHSLSLYSYRESLSLPFVVRKTLGLRVYVVSISNEFYFT